MLERIPGIRDTAQRNKFLNKSVLHVEQGLKRGFRIWECRENNRGDDFLDEINETDSNEKRPKKGISLMNVL